MHFLEKTKIVQFINSTTLRKLELYIVMITKKEVARRPTVGRLARGLDVRQEINDGIRSRTSVQFPHCTHIPHPKPLFSRHGPA